MLDLPIGEPVGLGVGQAPERIAEIGAAPVGFPVALHGVIESAHRFPGMAGQQVQFAASRVGSEKLPVQRDALVEPSEPHQGGGQGGSETAIVRLHLNELPCLLVGLFELGLADQQVGVVDACLNVVGLELHATLEQELRIVVDLQSCADVRKQTHALDMAPVAFEECPAEPFGLV